MIINAAIGLSSITPLDVCVPPIDLDARAFNAN